MPIPNYHPNLNLRPYCIFAKTHQAKTWRSKCPEPWRSECSAVHLKWLLMYPLHLVAMPVFGQQGIWPFLHFCVDSCNCERPAALRFTSSCFIFPAVCLLCLSCLVIWHICGSLSLFMPSCAPIRFWHYTLWYFPPLQKLTAPSCTAAILKAMLQCVSLEEVVMENCSFGMYVWAF